MIEFQVKKEIRQKKELNTKNVYNKESTIIYTMIRTDCSSVGNFYTDDGILFIITSIDK